MQKFAYLLLFCVLSFWASGQRIVTQGEYYWDGDPGVGNGVALSAVDGSFDEAIEDLFKNGIDVSSLSVGAHNFSVRVKGQDGTWSNIFRQTIYISIPLTTTTRNFQLSQAEYFWDGDPGLGNGTPLLALDGAFDEAIETMFQNGIDVSALSVGAHSFSVRLKGQDGNWSNIFKQTVYISVPLTVMTRTFKITQSEYYWDGDPGLGNGTPLLATDGSYDEAIEDLFQNGINVSALSVGAHNFSVRAKGQDGNWSNIFKQTIYISVPLTVMTRTFKITQSEYYWDGDPGLGNGTPLLATDGNYDEAIEDLFKNGISVSSLSVGAHNFSVRAKGDDGAWSNIFRQTVYISVPLTILTRTFKVTQAEYFWDGDPGLGNGTPLLATDGNYDEAIEDLFKNGISVAALSVGAHNFTVRVKGQDGGWSAIFRQTIYISTPLVAITRTFRLTQGEYYWDTDPGQGSATPLLALDGGFDEALEDLVKMNVDVSALSLGAHSFGVRVRGLDGAWSPVFRQTIYIGCSTPVPPTISIAVSGNGACQGSSVQFTATTTNGGTTPTYIWRVNGVPTGPNSAIFTSSSLVNGDVVTCELTSNSSCASPSTATSNSITVSLSTTVTPTVSISSSAGSSICVGTSVTFTASITNGGTTPVYAWKVNGVSVGTNSPTYTTSTLNNGDVVRCDLTSNAVCAVPTSLSSNVITMTVSTIVTPTITINANSTNACSGTTITFTANVSGQGSSPSYQWYINGSPVGTNSSIYASSSFSNGDVVTCTLTSSSPCATTSTANSNSVTLTINPNTSTSVSIAVSPGTSICAGTTVTFTATPTNGGSSPSYQWYVNGSPVGVNSSTFVTSGLSDGAQIQCVMSSSLPCTSPASSNFIVMTVFDSSPPTASITSSQGSTICNGTNVTFTASVTNGGSTPSYQWYLNGSPVGTNSSTYSNASLSNGNAVSCVVTSNASCVNGMTATSNTITITVTSPVTPSVSISASTTTICAGSMVTFTANPVNGGGSPSYQWQVNGFNVGSGTSTYATTGLNNGDIVTCILTTSLTCVTSSTATSNSVSMTVNPVVSTSVSISSSAGSTICSGTSVTFTATPANGGTPTYQWYVNGSPVGTNSATYVTSSLANGNTVYCTMTSSLSCPSPAVATSNTITMTVNSTAAPTISIGANFSSICYGTNVTFTANVTNGGSMPSYQWYLNGSPVGTNSPVYTNNALVNGDAISCIVTSNAPCVTGSTANSNVIVISVTTPVTPTVSISASATTICAGTSVTFTANPTNGGGSPTYQWMVNGLPVGTNSGTYTSSSLNNGDVVTCQLTSSISCVTSSTAASNSVAMTVNPTVTTSVSITSNVGSTICEGTSVTFTATPTNGGTPTYQWLLNGSPVGTNSNTYVNASLNNADIVSCQMISSLSCPVPSTAVSNIIAMTVNSTDTPTASITSNQGTSTCSGTNVTFTATVTNGGSSPVYQWYLNGTPVGTNNATYSNAALNDNDQVYCDVTSNSPCVNGTIATSNTITMTVNPTVSTSVSISTTSPTTICSGTSVTFTATPTNGGTPFYQWQVNGSDVGTNSATYTTSSLANGQTVTCLMTSSLTCGTPAVATSNGISFTVNSSATPTISITSNPSAATICSGTNVTFTANITNGGSSPSYQWYLNGSPVGTNSSTYVNSSLATGDAVTCELTSNAPCVSVTTVTSNSISKTVNPSVTPTITITSNPTMPVCDFQSVTFTAAITDGGSSPSYQWKKNNQNYGTNSATYSTSSWNEGDVYTCVLTSNATCATTNTVTSNGITMDIVTIDITTSVSGNTISANQAGATYQWFNCTTQQPIAGATQQSYTVSATGLYGVYITMGSCTEESNCELVNFNGIGEFSSTGIVLYPNPTKDNFTIELPNGSHMEMTIYDVAGRKVQERTLDGELHQVDVSQLATGTYRIVLSDSNGQYVGKVVVNR